MSKKLIVAVLLLIAIMAGTLTGCNNGGGTQSDTITVTDMLGRTVEVPKEINKVACIAAGALRLYSYVGDMSKLCGVENCEKSFLISARPYQIVNEDLFESLTSIGTGGPTGSPDAEALINSDADVIFSLYTSDVSAMNDLQTNTGIPVVTLSYGNTEAFDDNLIQSIKLMGKVLGREARANAVADYINAIKTDLNDRTKNIADSTKETVYLACQSNYGAKGFGSSTAQYSLFDAVNAINVLDASYTGYQRSLDLETIVTLDPDVIIVDAGGLSILRTDYQANKAVYDSLSAFQNNKVYVQMPYNAYYTNLEIAYADAYFIGTVLYPDEFDDIDIEDKFDEISTFLLGSPCYSEVVASVGGGYRQLDISTLNA